MASAFYPAPKAIKSMFEWFDSLHNVGVILAPKFQWSRISASQKLYMMYYQDVKNYGFRGLDHRGGYDHKTIIFIIILLTIIISFLKVQRSKKDNIKNENNSLSCWTIENNGPEWSRMVQTHGGAP